MNLVVLFLTSWVFGLISIVLMIAIVILLQFSGKTKDWGDVSQALVYHQVDTRMAAILFEIYRHSYMCADFEKKLQVRKFLLILDSSEKSHSKFWRPSFLVLVDDMYRPYSLLGTLESLKKGGKLRPSGPKTHAHSAFLDTNVWFVLCKRFARAGCCR